MGLVEIEYDDVDDGFTDIADDVIYRTAAFEGQLAAIPGMFEFVVADIDQVHDFVTGREMRLTIDGQRYWGGFLTQVEMFYATIVDTEFPANVEVRQWQLRGVDYNILFDKRVLANYANPTSGIPNFDIGTEDGDAITYLMNHFLELDDDGLDLSGIENVAVINEDAKGRYGVPGEKWRQTMTRFANSTGATWYIDASKTVVNRAREDVTQAWGFSDKPDNVTTFGPQGIRYTLDGSSMVNDALVWGGTGFNGTVVFGRVENTDSISDGLRMQYGGVHFNDNHYATNKACRIHAAVIVTGAPGTVAIVGNGPDSERGLQNPQQLLSMSWFYGMVPGPLVPGTVVTTTLYTFGAPKVITLPLRSVRISFLSPEIIRFDGSFGIQTADPYSLWSYMKRQADEAKEVEYVPPIDDDATEPVPGGTFNSSNVTPLPDGSTTVFLIRFPYIAGSTRVYKNGLLLVRGTDYTESDPTTGEITMTTAPAESDVVSASAQAIGTGGDGGTGGTAPTVTHEYGGVGSGLQSFINGVPNGAVVGLVANQVYNLGTNGQLHLSGRNNITIVARGAVLFRPNRGTTPILLVDGGGTNFKAYDLTIRGSKPADGLWSITYEHEHGIGIGGVVGWEFIRCRVELVGGDGMYLSGGNDTWTENGRFHHGSFYEIGRMGIAVTDGARNCRIDNSTWSYINYYLWDIEPNGATVDGIDAGGDGITFDHNTVGLKPWGNYPDDMSQAFGYGLASTGASGGGPAWHIDMDSNAFTQTVMRVAAFGGSMDNQDFNVTNNTAAVEFEPDGEISHAVDLDSVTGGSIIGNLQPSNPDASFETHDASITVSGNSV